MTRKSSADLFAGVRENLPIVRFVGVTVAALVGFFVVVRLSVVQATVVAPYTRFVASSSRVALRLFGIDATGTGTRVVSPEFAVNILNVCNGVEVTAILFAVILAFPARWKYKLLGLAVGYPVIFLVNLARIVVLFFLGFQHPDVFETAHYYYAQAFVILATVAVWLAWVSRYSAYGAKSD